MAPIFYNKIWSQLPSWKSPLGRTMHEEKVIPYGPYLEDNVDLGGQDMVYQATQINVVLRQMIRVLATLVFIVIIFPILIIKALNKCF